MTLLTHLLRSKGPLNIARRGLTIGQRVGFTPARMARSLQRFSALLARYDAHATFPVPALTLRRNPRLFHALQAGPACIELAVHGYRHIDLSLLTAAEQVAELRRAQTLFATSKTAFTGFRAPYLRWNDSLLAALSGAGFAYDSSQSILWPVVDLAALAPAQAAKTRILLDFCRPQPAQTVSALPGWVDGLLELPVSFPDDEMLVERLGLTAGREQAQLWLAAFEQCHDRGELFVLQLHPERFFLCAEALEAVLARARAAQPAVWLASLGEIADWWREKQRCRIRLQHLAAARWAVQAEGPTRAILLARDSAAAPDAAPAPSRYRAVASRDFILDAAICPGVGLPADAPLALRQFLADQGYAWQVGGRPEDYTVFLDLSRFAAEDALPILAHIEATPGPLVRFARWPGAAASALAITGDIDSLTVWDYAVRLAGA